MKWSVPSSYYVSHHTPPKRLSLIPVNYSAVNGFPGTWQNCVSRASCYVLSLGAFIKAAMKRHGSPKVVVTDGLRSYTAAMKEIGNAEKQEVGRWLNNRAENSHQPFRRRERAMLRFRRMKTLQKFASVHSTVHNHFNQERHLISREQYKDRRSAAFAEWKLLAA
jgi:hypothetical protein